MSLLLTAVVLCASTWAVEDERREPLRPEIPEPPPPPAPPDLPEDQKDDQRILVEALDGIRLVSDAVQVKKEDIELFGIEIVDIPLIDNEEFRTKIHPFLGKPISLAAIRELARTIIRHFREIDRPFIDVSIPEQDITGGVVQLLVQEAKLGEIRVEGNKYWRTKQFLQAIKLKPGESVSEKQLIENLNYFNNNAFRRIKPVFKPGKTAGTTDLVLMADERFPVRVYTGYEDTGSQSTGIDRLLFGFNWGNAFMVDHEIGYQYATDIDFYRLQSHSGYWRIPLPHRHKLTVTAGVSTIEANLDENLDNPAFSYQFGLRYHAPLPPIGHYRHDGILGFDFKETNNDLEFGGVEVFSSSYHIAQFNLQYSGSLGDAWGDTSFSLIGNFSPGHFTHRSTTETYKAARPDTDPQYSYGQLNLERIWKLPKEVTLHNRFKGQVSTKRLQSTEQLLLGGYNSVRGYDDRLVASDEGVQANVELRSPDFLVGRLGGDDRFESRLQFLIFYDFAWGCNKGDVFGEPKIFKLESVGGGLRWRIGSHLNARFDYGRQLRDLPGDVQGGDHGRVHLGVVVSF